MARFLAEHSRLIALTLYLIAVFAVGFVVFWNSSTEHREPL